jgi:hypothetical protein
VTELEAQFFDSPDGSIVVSALELRSVLASLQEGVLAAGDLKVSASAVGRSVDVAAGITFIQGDSVADQGLYRARNDATKNSETFETGGIGANASGNPRIDSIVYHLYDQTHDNSGLRKARLEVAPGTPTAGATLDNRNGAPGGPGGPGLPLSAVRLADVLVPAGATSILAGNVRDRRPWARGGFTPKTTTTQYTIATTMAELDTVNFKPRIECSGAPLRIHLQASLEATVGGDLATFALFEDGAEKAGYRFRQHTPANNYDSIVSAWWEFTPAPGSHLYSPAAVCPATGTLRGAADNCRTFFTVEEIARQSADNT